MSTQTNDVNDIDPIETQEWLDALSSVLESEGERIPLTYANQQWHAETDLLHGR